MILAFTDCETTHLSSEIGEAWEVAVIRREHDGTQAEHVWQFRPLDMSAANPESLKIGHYEERFAVPEDCGAAYTADGDIDPMTRTDAITEVIEILRGATIVGSNPGFDDRFLRKLVGLGNHQWAYRPTCIAILAEGFLRGMDPQWVAAQEANGPISSRALSRRLGVEPPGDDAHQALADARWAMAVYDAVGSFANADQVYRDAYTTGRAHGGGGQLNKGEWVFCSQSRCPNGERSGKAAERGWRQSPAGAWFCDAHPAGGAA